MPELTEDQEQEVQEMVDDTFANEYDSKEFIKACVYEHYEREILGN